MGKKLVENFFFKCNKLYNQPKISQPPCSTSAEPLGVGTPWGSFLLMKECFLSTVAKVLLIVGTVGFLYTF